MGLVGLYTRWLAQWPSSNSFVSKDSFFWDYEHCLRLKQRHLLTKDFFLKKKRQNNDSSEFLNLVVVTLELHLH